MFESRGMGYFRVWACPRTLDVLVRLLKRIVHDEYLSKAFYVWDVPFLSILEF